MTRKGQRPAAWGSTTTASRRPGGVQDSRSASPRSRGRVTPPLPDIMSRTVDYHPTLLSAFTRCIGASVCVQTQKGERFEGILHTPGLEQSSVHFVLRKARKLKQDGAETLLIEKLVIPCSEVVQMCAKDVPIHPEPPRPTPSPVLLFQPETEVHYQFGDFDDIAFLGDNDRERDGAGLFGRELQKWEPEEGMAGLDLNDSDHRIGTWDQFAENERKFGVKTDFNMDLYTTPLEPEKSKYTVEEATQIARTIQSASSPNLHLQDERGQLTLDDSGVSEEMLYSSVLTASVAKNEKSHVETIVKSEQSDKGAMTQDDKSSSSKSPEPRRMPLILSTQGTPRPMIINNKQKPEAKGEYLKVVRGLSKLKPDTHGSPLRTSPLVHDPQQLRALDLTFGQTNRRMLDAENHERFRKYKTEVKGQSKPAQPSDARKQTWLRFKEDSERMALAKTPKKGDSPSQQSTPAAHALDGDVDRGAFGSQMLDDDVVPEGGSNSNNDRSDETTMLIKDLPHVKTVVDGVDEDDMHDANSARGGLNPHATPFNPGPTTQNASPLYSTLNDLRADVDGTAVELSPHGSATGQAVVVAESPATAKVGRKISISDSEEFPPLPSPQIPVEVSPPPVAQPVLIRPPPPPPPPQSVQPPQQQPHQQAPPRVVTPPPPAIVPETDHHQPTPIVMPVPITHRMPPSNKNSSPAGHRTPINNVHPDPPPNMIINQPTPPHIMIPGPQSGTPQPTSGPPMPANGPPQQMGQPMMHMSGAMHVMPQQMGPYAYGPEMAARMQVIYPFPGHMPPVAGQPAPPGQQSNPNSDQPMQQHPMIFTPFYSGMPVPYPYGPPPMMPPGAHYYPMPPAPMAQQRPGTGSGPRPRPRRTKGAFLNYGARRS